MANTAAFVAYALEMMRPAGRASSRAMFGAHGIYVDGLIVGIVAEDVLYLKADAESRASFVAQDLAPFRYRGHDGELHETSYFRAPDEALESPAAMRDWLRLAVAAALRSAAAKRRKSRRAGGR